MRSLVLSGVALQACVAATPTPPPSGPAQAAPAPGSTLASLHELKVELAPFRNSLKARAEAFGPELAPLVAEIGRRQKEGRSVSCSYQMYRELRWRLSFTSDEPAVRARLKDLKDSLASDADQSWADTQAPEDGSWGRCYKEWFMKTWASVETLEDLAKSGKLPEAPLRFLDRVNSPELLTEYLRSVRASEIGRTGELTRVRADDSVSALGRLLLDGIAPPSFQFHGDLAGAYLQFLDDEWQNPATGMWGLWFVLPDGRTLKTDDTGITFHILSQRRGQVKHKDRLARGMLALRGKDFPFGWRLNGHYENHLSWDAAKIFRYAWPYSPEAERAEMAAEIQATLDFSLKESLTDAGEFKTSDLDDTPGDAAENGVSFLREVGYFDKSKRFWTSQTFPGAEELRKKITQHLQSTGLVDPAFRRAYDMIGG